MTQSKELIGEGDYIIKRSWISASFGKIDDGSDRHIYSSANSEIGGVQTIFALRPISNHRLLECVADAKRILIDERGYGMPLW
jgi:hypothetical protein